MKLPVEKLLSLIESSKLDYRKKNVIGKCPQCKQDEFGISVEDNHLFGCYRGKCGFRGNIFTLLRFLGKLDQYIDSVDGEIYSRTNDKLVNRLNISSTDIDLNLPVILKPIGWKRTLDNPYLNTRGFVEYDRYKVGTSSIDPKLRDYYIIFLIEERGSLVGYIARHIWDKKKIDLINKKYKEAGILKKVYRYRNSQETDFSKLFFGYDEVTPNTHTIILVEGIFDKFNVDKLLNLHSQEGIKCLCTFKCHISPEQLYKLKIFPKIDNIILLYDPDVEKEIRQVGLELEAQFSKVRIGFSTTGKDPGDMTGEDIDKILGDLRTPQGFVTNRVQVKRLL